MKDHKYESLFTENGSDTITKELIGIIAFSFVVAFAIVLSIFLMV